MYTDVYNESFTLLRYVFTISYACVIFNAIMSSQRTHKIYFSDHTDWSISILLCSVTQATSRMRVSLYYQPDDCSNNIYIYKEDCLSVCLSLSLSFCLNAFAQFSRYKAETLQVVRGQPEAGRGGVTNFGGTPGWGWAYT